MNTDVLKNLVCAMERAMDRRRLARMTLAEAEGILDTIEQFNLMASHTDHALPVKGMTPIDARASGRIDSELECLLAAGYRLCSDLSEHVLMRLVDIYQDRQHSIDFMNAELRRKIRERASANMLIQQAQQVRNHLSHTSQAQGLGVLI
jgi:hypothetical protein